MRTCPRTLTASLAAFVLLGCVEDAPTDLTEPELEPQLHVASARHPVHWLSDLSDVPGATAKLNRTHSGVTFTFRTSGFEHGHVATLWWVIFNHPEACANPIPSIGAACGLPDLFNEDVAASVMYAAGNIVGRSGKVAWGGSLRVGEITRYHPAFDGAPGLLGAMDAEIHMVARTHGPLIPRMAHGMLTTFEVGCTPETSGGFGNGPNACADLQAAAFPAP
ncbi:MAG: hypothetical protein R3304_09700 [Longimicrobiales bacterium]|nr:hypothetical protein [Longimicrobiales bacterium]